MKQYLKIFLLPSHVKRIFFFFLFDILLLGFSLYISFLIRFDFTVPPAYLKLMSDALLFFIGAKVILFAGFRMYKITWRYVGINDLCNIVSAIAVSESVLMVLILVPFPPSVDFISLSFLKGFPRSIFLIDAIVSLLLTSGLRISKRLYLEVLRKKRHLGRGKQTIIVGAGNTGEMVLRDMVRQGFSDFYPVAMLDDDPKKLGSYVHGVKVVGETDELKSVVSKFDAEAVIIAIPSLNYKILRKIYNSAKEAKVQTVKIVPRIYDFHRPDINLKKLEEIKIEDLIGRQTVKVDYEKIEEFLKDRVVLITGAGGSIGSEIVMQVCAFHPGKVVLFEIDETELHNLELKLKKAYPHLFENLHFVVGDIRDKERVDEVFHQFKPQIVFHSAAYKHVPMMEYNPQEAVKVNIFGTYNLALASAQHNIEKFIMISTDKAVRPTSVMGATKRVAEYICTAFNMNKSQKTEDREKKTEFVSVRFGNVLGSRGSVLPIFMEQLKRGGPLTVTHKDMQRYFMTIPEAVSLVLQASVIGEGGEVLVLDMSEPVKIVNLAEELIRINGLEPYKDIDIEFVGLRPGEKLFEEILTAEEGTVATKHEKVFIAKNSEKYSLKEINGILESFEQTGKESPTNSADHIRDLLRRYVRHFDGI